MSVPQILGYSPTRRRRFPWRRLLAVALIAGGTYWRLADWWAYVDSGPTAWPKFRMPFWWQVLESAAVGLMAAGLVWSLWFAVRRFAGR